MFVHDRDKKAIDLEGQKVLTLIQSINRPMVAAADFPAEETQAFIITTQAPNHSLNTYIYLHLLKSNLCTIFSYDVSPFMGDRLEEVEFEGLDFVESMGFMMDNLNFNRLKSPERDVLMRDLPIFYRDLKDFKPILLKNASAEEMIESKEEVMQGEELASEPFEPLQPSFLGPSGGFPPDQSIGGIKHIIDAKADAGISPAVQPQIRELDPLAKDLPSFPADESMAYEDAQDIFVQVDSSLPAEPAMPPPKDEDTAYENFSELFEPPPNPKTATEEQPQFSQAEELIETGQPVKDMMGHAEHDLAALEKMENSLGDPEPKDGEGEIPVALDPVSKPDTSPGEAFSNEELKEILGLLLSL